MRHVALAALLCLVSPALLAGAAGPRAVVSEPTHMLEEVPLDRPAHYSFAIANEGDAPLELQVAGFTDLCQVDRKPLVVPKGGNTLLAVTFDTKPLTRGGECKIALTTNDPEHARLDLTLAVTPQTLIKANPGYARYIFVLGEREGTVKQVLWATDGKDFHVLGVTAPPELVTTFRPAKDTERERDKPGAQWVVETTIVAQPPVGPLEGAIEIRVDHPQQKLVRLPVSGFVRPVLHVTPPEAKVGDVPLTGEVSLDFFVRNFATEPIHLLRAESSVPGTRAEIKPRDEGRSWDVRVVLTPQMKGGAFAGNLTIITDSYKVPKLVVPIEGNAVRQAPG
jgi:hypothetical protein